MTNVRVVLYRRKLNHTGGVERYVAATAEGLTGRGHRVAVVSAELPDRFVTAPGVERYETRERVTRFGAVLPALPVVVARVRPDVVHLHGANTRSAAAFLRRSRVRVLTPYFHEEVVDSPRRDVIRERMRCLVRWATGLVFMNDTERLLFAGFVGLSLPENRIIPPGPDAGPRSDALSRDLFVAVARLVDAKRLDLVVEAAADARCLDRLRIVGSGPEERRLRELVERCGGEPDSVLLGRIEDAALADLLARAHALVSMSESESYGITLLEGLTAGAAVVASAISAHRAVLAPVPEAYRTLVPAGDREALRAAFERPPRVPPTPIVSRPWSTVVDELADFYSVLGPPRGRDRTDAR